MTDSDRPDPIRRAQALMRSPPLKRSYTRVDVLLAAEGWQVLLDERPTRTPARQLVILATEAAAQVVAEEWRAQGATVDASSMPATRIVNTALDSVARDVQAVRDEILKYAGSDLVCYRATGPQALVAQQASAWDPVLDLAARVLDARFTPVEGVNFVEQPADALAAISRDLADYPDPISVAALSVMTSLTGSALLALLVARRALGVERAWAAAHVDEDWTNAQWGHDAEAALRRDVREREMRAAVRLLLATTDSLDDART